MTEVHGGRPRPILASVLRFLAMLCFALSIISTTTGGYVFYASYYIWLPVGLLALVASLEVERWR